MVRIIDVDADKMKPDDPNYELPVSNAGGVLMLRALNDESSARDINKVDRRVQIHSIFPITEENQTKGKL
jgi:hypothetical protein